MRLKTSVRYSTCSLLQSILKLSPVGSTPSPITHPPPLITRPFPSVTHPPPSITHPPPPITHPPPFIIHPYVSASRDRPARCAQEQLCLPIRMGGFGLWYSAKLAHLSHACSWLSCIQPMIQDMRVEGGTPCTRELILVDEPVLGGAAAWAATQLPAPVQDDLPSISSALQL